MLDEIELLRRFDQIVPGEILPGHGASFSDADIYFERLSMSGLDEMHRYSRNPRLYEFFEFDPFDTIEKTKVYIEKIVGRMAVSPESRADSPNRTAMYWLVRRRADRYLIGTAALVNLNIPFQSIEWGYGVDPELWGAGYVLQIQEYLKQYAFETLELNRLHGVTMIENERTIQSVIAAGAKHEATLRQHYRKGEIYHDGWSYAILSENYFQNPETASNNNLFTLEDVIEIVSSVLVDENIDEDTSMENSDSWDSINHMSIMLAIAERTGISFSSAEIAQAISMRAITAALYARTQHAQRK
jgi:RimJ/RimL family protein N-acetyltransferase/acyl carrier protein